MGNAEVVAGWTSEPGEGASSLKHLGQRLQESLASRDEGGVKIEQFNVAPVPLGQCEPVAPGKVVEETAPLERLLVDRGSVPGVENSWELIEVAREQKLNSFWLIKLCPKTGFDLGHFLNPDHICRTGAVEDMSSYVVVGRAAPSSRGRRVSFSNNVDFFP